MAAIPRLEAICHRLEDGIPPERLKIDLQAAAELLHCIRFHRPQAPEKVEEWVSTLNSRRSRASTQARESYRTEHNSPQSPLTAPNLTICEDEELLAELSSRLGSERLSLLLLRSLVEDPIPRSGQSHHSSRVSGGSTSAGRQLAGDEATVLSDSGYESGSSSPYTPSASISPGSSSRSSTVPISSRSSTYGSISSSSSSPPSTTSNSPRRSQRTAGVTRRALNNTDTGPSSPDHVETPDPVIECGICLERLPRSDDMWTCTSCHNATHTLCFNQWMASSADIIVRCIYWYVVSFVLPIHCLR